MDFINGIKKRKKNKAEWNWVNVFVYVKKKWFIVYVVMRAVRWPRHNAKQFEWVNGWNGCLLPISDDLKLCNDCHIARRKFDNWTHKHISTQRTSIMIFISLLNTLLKLKIITESKLTIERARRQKSPSLARSFARFGSLAPDLNESINEWMNDTRPADCDGKKRHHANGSYQIVS